MFVSFSIKAPGNGGDFPRAPVRYHKEHARKPGLLQQGMAVWIESVYFFLGTPFHPLLLLSRLVCQAFSSRGAAYSLLWFHCFCVGFTGGLAA